MKIIDLNQFSEKKKEKDTDLEAAVRFLLTHFYGFQNRELSFKLDLFQSFCKRDWGYIFEVALDRFPARVIHWMTRMDNPAFIMALRKRLVKAGFF